MRSGIGVAILGGTGFGAGELLRFLYFHPEAEVVSIVSNSAAGKSVESAHPHLRSAYPVTFSAEADWSALADYQKSIVFLALPHGNSGSAVEVVENKLPRAHCIDLSGDFRLGDATAHRQSYGDTPFLPDLRSRFVYGLSELNREQIRSARHVANPGCLATATLLAAAPLRGKVAGAFHVTAQTGSSGAGRGLRETTHHPTRHSDLFAYKLFAHQHEAELLQELQLSAKDITFITQSLPISRGIYVTLQATLKKPVEKSELTGFYAQCYTNSPSVRLLDEPPHLAAVIGTNYCDIHVAVRDREVVCLAAIDNLGKGMAGQAIQNLNILSGLDEHLGISIPALGPVIAQ